MSESKVARRWWVNGLVVNCRDKFWFLDGKYHREDGPAIEFVDGDKQWWLNGELHREDGPACEHADGYKSWFYHGKLINCKTNEEFLKLVKLKAFW